MDPAKCASLYYFNEKDEPVLNITDWGLKQFTEHYKDETLTKEKIFYYTYAVIYNPNYREKYKQNLKREFPRLPFYADFRKWSEFGKKLLDLHIHFETVDPYNLKVDTQEIKENPNPKLKAIKDKAIIILDENTTISNLPEEVWEYKLGNRIAIDWVLNQFHETTYSKKTIDNYPDKKTLHENFNKYKFSDYKDHVIDLLKRLTTVSIKTVEIMKEMKKIKV
jgi:predicted helicase